MSTDIAQYTNNAVAAFGGGGDTEQFDRLARWVEAASNANRLVAPLVGTAFVPDAYRPKIDPRSTPEQKAEANAVAVANATAAVLQGSSLGLDPLISLQQIIIVKGRPSMYAKMMVALVQSRGHEVWTEDNTATRAVVAGRRRGSEHIERVTITMEMARQAKWTTNAKYQETPHDMLWSRAAARVCDRIASDVLKGLASVEEARDDEARDEPAAATRTVAAPRQARKRAATTVAATVGRPVDEPPLDDEPTLAMPEPEPALELSDRPERPVSAPPAPPTEDPITKAQQGKMFALFAEKSLDKPTQQRQYCADVIGRQIASRSDLTKDEAAQIIDGLEALPVAGPSAKQVEATKARMLSLFAEKGLDRLANQRRFYDEILGREVRGAADLTYDEIVRISAELEVLPTLPVDEPAQREQHPGAPSMYAEADGWPDAAVPGGAA